MSSISLLGVLNWDEDLGGIADWDLKNQMHMLVVHPKNLSAIERLSGGNLTGRRVLDGE